MVCPVSGDTMQSMRYQAPHGVQLTFRFGSVAHCVRHSADCVLSTMGGILCHAFHNRRTAVVYCALLFVYRLRRAIVYVIYHSLDTACHIIACAFLRFSTLVHVTL